MGPVASGESIFENIRSVRADIYLFLKKDVPAFVLSKISLRKSSGKQKKIPN